MPMEIACTPASASARNDVSRTRDAEARSDACLLCSHNRTWRFRRWSMHLRSNASAYSALVFNPFFRRNLFSLQFDKFYSSYAPRLLRTHYQLPRFCQLAAMPPKQATLGYVRPSQITLGCDDHPKSFVVSMHNSTNNIALTGNSSGNQTAPQPNPSNRSSPSQQNLRSLKRMMKPRMNRCHLRKHH